MLRVVASSVRGPAHKRERLPCQDAWSAVTIFPAGLAVVCDGLGSRLHSREGARAATRAARDAWRAWRHSPVAAIEDFIRLLEVWWRLRLGDIRPEEASTTCLLYAEDGHGRAALAQLGDGLIAHRACDGQIRVHPARSGEFGLTHALGTPHSLNDWSFSWISPLSQGEALILATDGVAEDLDPSRLGDLLEWVTGDLGIGPFPSRRLSSELRNWGVPNHQDDKTLLVMWNS